MSAALYWDTSALLKLYAQELDSSAYRQMLIARKEHPVVSFLHRVELFYALRHKEARAEIAPGAAARLFSDYSRHLSEGGFHVISWRDDLARESHELLDQCLGSPASVSLRSLDGLHLSALCMSGASGLVTTDAGMRRAAGKLGIRLVDP